MATLTFETLRFLDRGETVQVDFLRQFSFSLPKSDLEAVGDVVVHHDGLEFPSMGEGPASRKVGRLLHHGFLHLTNRLSGKPTVYVHRGSGIPLRGHIAFGVIDRGSNIIEVKPVTSCNIACTYCSVNEDVRPVDFVVEMDYLVEEFNALVAEKDTDQIEAHIASQGEPMLYADIVPLVKALAANPKVTQIVTDTNGTVLTPAKIDELAEAGFTRFNLSINAMDPKKAKVIAAAPYSIEHVKKIAKYIAEHPTCDLCISPTLIAGLNEEELPKILAFAKSLENPHWRPKVGIQNFLEYRFGRNPAKQIPWEDFYERLRSWEKEFDLQLIVGELDFGVHKSKPAPSIFSKGEIVQAEIKCRGRLPGEKIAVARGRCISVPKCPKPSGKVKLKITKVKHGLYVGELLS